MVMFHICTFLFSPIYFSLLPPFCDGEEFEVAGCLSYAEVIGALISILIIWVVTAVLVGLAIQRVRYPGYEIEGVSMVVTAFVGVIFNIV